jgi:hypothetical protein
MPFFDEARRGEVHMRVRRDKRSTRKMGRGRRGRTKGEGHCGIGGDNSGKGGVRKWYKIYRNLRLRVRQRAHSSRRGERGAATLTTKG